MDVSMLLASDDATSGSVMQNADLTSPSSSGMSQRSICSALPNSASSSMLPVSGAEQFSASGAIAPLRPVISASGAYCRLVSPAPYFSAIRPAWSSSPSGPGARTVRNRFHRPRLRACAFSSSITGGRCQIWPARAACSTWSANTCSAG